MSIILKRWTKDGKPPRLYVNGYAAGGAVWLQEAPDDGVAVHSTADAGSVDEVDLLGRLSAAYGLRAPSWEAFERAASMEPERQSRLTGRRVPTPGTWTAMDAALLDMSRPALPAEPGVRFVVGDGLPEELVERLRRVRGAVVEQGEPSWGSLSAGRACFVRLPVADLAGADGDGALPPPPPDGVSAFVLLEGMPPTPTGTADFVGYSRRIAVIALRAAIVPTLSPAHGAHMAVEVAKAMSKGAG